jgi:hypothetical protein
MPPGYVLESGCGPLVFVSVSFGVDCGESFVFDAATGALVATLGGCATSQVCASLPGFKWPSSCPGAGPNKQLCPAGGTDAGDAREASVEAAADGGLDAAGD